jgi:hypothetical protein
VVEKVAAENRSPPLFDIPVPRQLLVHRRRAGLSGFIALDTIAESGRCALTPRRRVRR